MIICSSTGDGDPPENAAKFLRQISRKTLPDTFLQNLTYALLGLRFFSPHTFGAYSYNFRANRCYSLVRRVWSCEALIILKINPEMIYRIGRLELLDIPGNSKEARTEFTTAGRNSLIAFRFCRRSSWVNSSIILWFWIDFCRLSALCLLCCLSCVGPACIHSLLSVCK